MEEVDTMQDSVDGQVDSLCAELWAWRLAESPELDTFCGVYQFTDLLDDISEETYIKRENTVREFLKKAEVIDANECSKQQKLSLFLLKDQLQEYLNGTPFKSYFFPINNLEGIQLDLMHGIQFMKYDTVEDFEKYVGRLEKVSAKVDQVVEVLNKGIEAGMVMHRYSLVDVPNQLQKMIMVPIEEHPLMKPFLSEDKKVSDDELQKVKTRAMDVITSSVQPAFSKIKKFIEEAYMRKTRPSECICSLPNGITYYQQCLDFHLSCHMTPMAVHELGLKEVARIQKLMKAVAKKGGYDHIFDYIKTLKTRESSKFQTPEAVLDYVKDLCNNKIQPKIETLFQNVPDQPLRIVPNRAVLQSSPAGFYYAGVPDGSRKGTYNLNTAKLDQLYRFELTALSLHEGIPGHHLQSEYALNEKGLPDFRRYSEDAKYYLSPSRFTMNTAYVEGWGLYCEALGEEMGVYDDNETLLGRYCMEIFRAARLVVDTGIHAFGWSRHRAVNYIVDQAMMDYVNVVCEVNRYITWPGQACAYKIGEMKFWELRHKAERELGHKFDIKAFHETILRCGPVPLRILENIVDEFIAEVGPPSKVENNDVTAAATPAAGDACTNDSECADGKEGQENAIAVSAEGWDESEARSGEADGESRVAEEADDCSMKTSGVSIEKENGEDLTV